MWFSISSLIVLFTAMAAIIAIHSDRFVSRAELDTAELAYEARLLTMKLDEADKLSKDRYDKTAYQQSLWIYREPLTLDQCEAFNEHFSIGEIADTPQKFYPVQCVKNVEHHDVFTGYRVLVNRHSPEIFDIEACLNNDEEACKRYYVNSGAINSIEDPVSAKLRDAIRPFQRAHPSTLIKLSAALVKDIPDYINRVVRIAQTSNQCVNSRRLEEQDFSGDFSAGDTLTLDLTNCSDTTMMGAAKLTYYADNYYMIDLSDVEDLDHAIELSGTWRYDFNAENWTISSRTVDVATVGIVGSGERFGFNVFEKSRGYGEIKMKAEVFDINGDRINITVENNQIEVRYRDLRLLDDYPPSS